MIVQKNNINKASDIKIGQRAKEYFIKYFSDTSKQYDFKNFLNKYWCHDTFGICYPLLKEVDITIPISKQKGYNNNYGRYWTKPVLKINGKHYIICSQWFKEFQCNLDKWISENPISDFKMPVYILPKAKTKICQKCGNKTEKEILFVTYHTAIADINNKLFIRRCSNCKTAYIADTIFKSYTKSKDIENINVNFIKQDS